jgi:hypothetical protein
MADEGQPSTTFLRAASKVVDGRPEPVVGRLTRGPDMTGGWAAYVNTFGRWYNTFNMVLPDYALSSAASDLALIMNKKFSSEKFNGPQYGIIPERAQPACI